MRACFVLGCKTMATEEARSCEAHRHRRRCSVPPCPQAATSHRATLHRCAVPSCGARTYRDVTCAHHAPKSPRNDCVRHGGVRVCTHANADEAPTLHSSYELDAGAVVSFEIEMSEAAFALDYPSAAFTFGPIMLDADVLYFE
ncbi:hypothetical protein SDRG_00978 [Saprolegnia diclina VS20]|uniref:Uncharacterized protein n=1 Tax=Saprolegnia diclina (strain VS20) TaxID=1156394 RepID=T0SA06_SAPDV|nr:hypothetical protein SDRG_00978 [Saprolegnia diclina VS20]EQC42138.1 hypothetical protein SDRG_00978 [Saprolegnia diclina VS20]|eukprot:XP_008604707.1 hypothetical protein SDRG_00978 [Saprolegnia diclina VS20]